MNAWMSITWMETGAMVYWIHARKSRCPPIPPLRLSALPPIRSGGPPARHARRRPLPLARGSGFARDGGVGGGAEQGHLRFPGIDSGARAAQGAPDRFVELRTLRGAFPQGRP